MHWYRRRSGTRVPFASSEKCSSKKTVHMLQRTKMFLNSVGCLCCQHKRLCCKHKPHFVPFSVCSAPANAFTENPVLWTLNSGNRNHLSFGFRLIRGCRRPIPPHLPDRRTRKTDRSEGGVVECLECADHYGSIDPENNPW